MAGVMTPMMVGGAVALSGWLSAYVVFCAVAVARATKARRARRASSGPAWARVLLIRPCTGTPGFLARALSSTAALRWDGPCEVRLTVARAADPAWPTVQRAAAELSAAGWSAEARVAATDALNGKAGQLAAATHDAERFDAVVVVDADVDLTGFYLSTLLDALDSGADASPAIGAVWAPPHETEGGRTFGDRVSGALLGHSLHAFDLLGRLDAGGLVGKCFAVRTDALREAGGFDAVSDRLGEDMELSRRLQARGWSTAVGAEAARSIATGRSLGAIVERYVRWLLVMRAQRPGRLWAYPLLLAASWPLALCSLVVATQGSVGWGVALLGGTLAARAGVVLATRSAAPRLTWTTPLYAAAADALLWVAWLSALTRRRTRWGGRELTLSADGRLVA
jgi:ceramide glucosyltransferase